MRIKKIYKDKLIKDQIVLPESFSRKEEVHEEKSSFIDNTFRIFSGTAQRCSLKQRMGSERARCAISGSSQRNTYRCSYTRPTVIGRPSRSPFKGLSSCKESLEVLSLSQDGKRTRDAQDFDRRR